MKSVGRIIIFTAITLAVLILADVLMADDLPDAPIPKAVETKVPPEHKFYDRTAKIELGINAVLFTVDSIESCNPNHRETFLPVQGCKNIVLFMAGEHALQEGAAFLLHKTGHHKLEKFARLGMTQAHAHAIIYNRTHS